MSTGPSAGAPGQASGPAQSSSTSQPRPQSTPSSQPRPTPTPVMNGSSTPSQASMNNAKKRKVSSPPARERNPSMSHEPHTDDDAASTVTHSRAQKEQKRTRVHFSCVECHRRKQKCDRKEPCSQCVARRVPHLCRPFLNGVEDPNQQTDVHARLNSIESLLSTLVTSMRHGTPTSHHPVDHPSPDSLSLTATGEEIFHPRSAPAPNEQIRHNLPQKPPPSGLFPANMSQTTPPGRSGFGWGLREGRMINLQTDDNVDLKEVLATLKESGISKNHLEWVISGVPGRRMADGLVELYFRDIDWTRYKINKASFMKRYDSFFDSIGRNPSSPRVDAEIVKWLPLCFIVLAISALSAPKEIIPTDEQFGWSRRFYGSAKSSLEYARALQRDNLDVLFAGLLASRYMLLTRRPAEGSTPLTTAFQLGLYRDGTVLNLGDKREIEVRRRAWSMLYHLDRTISLLVGRPASISDAHTDTRMPANLDDEELEGDFDPAGHPLTKPTVYTYVIVRHKLAEIMGRIAYHTFAIQLPDYSTVLNLDRELIAWRDALPPFFAITNADTSLDADNPYLFVQRHLLACEWFYTRITLNRPYLLRRKPQDGRYAYSKNAAIESATADLLSRRSFVMEKGNLIVNSGGYRVLNSYMVLGVTIKLDPDSAQADELRKLLNIVSGRAPDSAGKTSEPLVKEELAIVEFLTAKTNYSKASNSSSDKPKNGDDQTPVDLLLGLAKTRSGKRAAEEEQRQLRLQALREIQEQQRTVKRNSLQSSSPWGYVAPQMPGLDVQQPFNMAGQRRAPRPLQPPPSKSRDEMSNGDPFSGSFNDGSMSNTMLDTPMNNGNMGNMSNVNNNVNNTTGNSSNNTNNNDNAWQSNIFSSMDGFPHPPFVNSPNRNPSPSQFQQNPFSMNNNVGLTSPMTGMTTLSNGSDIFGQQQNMDANAGFGPSIFDSFDFGDLNFGGGPAVPAGSIDGTSFNPFALAQNVDDGSPNNTDDDQTQFLNYILTKIANSQPEVQ